MSSPASERHGWIADTARSGPPLLQLATERHAAADAVVVRAAGEIDYDSAPALRAALDDSVAASPDAVLVVIDLSAVAFVDSQGLAELIRAHQRITATGRHVRLAGATGSVLALLTVTATGDLLGHRATLSDALGDGAQSRRRA